MSETVTIRDRPVSADDWAARAADLLPPGLFWQGFRTRHGKGRDLLRARGEAYTLVSRWCDHLTRETFPATASKMLPDWERTLGLPDSCTQDGSTAAERNAAVVARLTMTGSATPAWFTAVAATLGYTVTIREYRAARCGLARCGHSETVNHRSLSHWRVAVPGPRLSRARCGVARCGESLGRFCRAEDLECLFQRLRPAGTTLHFDYGER